MARFVMVWYGMVRSSRVLHGTVRYGIVRHDTVWYVMKWYSIWYFMKRDSRGRERYGLNLFRIALSFVLNSVKGMVGSSALLHYMMRVPSLLMEKRYIKIGMMLRLLLSNTAFHIKKGKTHGS